MKHTHMSVRVNIGRQLLQPQSKLPDSSICRARTDTLPWAAV